MRCRNRAGAPPLRLWLNYGNEVALGRRLAMKFRHTEVWRNKSCCPVPVPPEIELTTDLPAAGADLTILAVPSFAVRDTAALLKPVINDGALIANASKGLEKGTHCRLSQVISEALPMARVAVLSGPSHAEEVARGVPTSIISACEDVEAAEQVQDIMMNPKFRIYVNTDVIGVELGGALKNVIALAAGYATGWKWGQHKSRADYPRACRNCKARNKNGREG